MLQSHSSSRAFQRNHHAAGVAFADALGADIGAIGQREMHDASFVRGHSLERNRAAIVTDLLGHAQGQGAQILLAAFAIILRIHDNAHAVFRAVAHDQAHQELEGRECFPTSSDQQAKILINALDIKRQRILRTHLDSRADIHILQNMLKDIDRHSDIFATRMLNLLHLAFRDSNPLHLRGGLSQWQSGLVGFILIFLVELLILLEVLLSELRVLLALLQVLLLIQLLVGGTQERVGHLGSNHRAATWGKDSDADAGLLAADPECATRRFLKDRYLHLVAPFMQTHQSLQQSVINTFATYLNAFHDFVASMYFSIPNVSAPGSGYPLFSYAMDCAWELPLVGEPRNCSVVGVGLTNCLSTHLPVRRSCAQGGPPRRRQPPYPAAPAPYVHRRCTCRTCTHPLAQPCRRW